MRIPIAIRNQGDPAVFQRILQLSDPFGLSSSGLKVSGWAGAVRHSTNSSGSDLVKTLAYTLTLSPKERVSFCAAPAGKSGRLNAVAATVAPSTRIQPRL